MDARGRVTGREVGKRRRVRRRRKRARKRAGRGMREKRKAEEKKRDERRKRGRREGGRKEGVRVRVRLGVGGAIRNYCGTIDKRRLRGCTTEDSLRPNDLPYRRRLFFRLFSPLPAPLDFRPRARHAVPPTTNLPASSICNVRESARALRHPRLI